MSKTQVTLRWAGRLGNQMFQYAYLRTLCEREGWDWSFPASKDLAEVFPYLERTNREGDLPATTFHIDMLEDWCTPGQTAELEAALRGGGTFDILGFHQDATCLGLILENYDRVRSWFSVTGNGWITDDKTCAIHIRGKDFLARAGNDWRVDPRFYLKAVYEVALGFGARSFLVVTDDVEYAKRILPSVQIVEQGSTANDFYTLLRASSLIMSNSTFCWWGAFLNPGRVIVSPLGWTDPDSTKPWAWVGVSAWRTIPKT